MKVNLLFYHPLFFKHMNNISLRTSQVNLNIHPIIVVTFQNIFLINNAKTIERNEIKNKKQNELSSYAKGCNSITVRMVVCYEKYYIARQFFW